MNSLHIEHLPHGEQRAWHGLLVAGSPSGSAQHCLVHIDQDRKSHSCVVLRHERMYEFETVITSRS
jgi:hypothetical protein